MTESTSHEVKTLEDGLWLHLETAVQKYKNANKIDFRKGLNIYEKFEMFPQMHVTSTHKN